MLAYTYPLADLFGTMLGIFVFIIWFWLLVIIFGDIFRSRDLGGGAKALWILFVIILPFLGILVYLIARGGKMHERAVERSEEQQKAFDAYVQQTAGASGSGNIDALAKLAALHDSGALNDDEFATQKAKLLA